MRTLLSVKKEYFENALIAAVMLVAVLPLVWFGRNSLLTVHDSLDSVMAWTKMLKDNGLLLAIDSPTNQLGNMSTAFFGHISYNIFTLLHFFMDVYTAFVVGYIIKIAVGYVSMFLLLRRLFPDTKNIFIIKLVSTSFALLPALPAYTFWVSLDAVPLLCYAFIVVMGWDNHKIDIRVFLLMLFPIISNFALVGFFALSLWGLSTTVFCIYKRALSRSLVTGFFCLTVGYVLVDLKLFYSVLLLSEPLNRSIFNPSQGVSIGQAILASSTEFLAGGYHAPLLAIRVIYPVVFIALASFVIFILHRISRRKHKCEHDFLATNSLAAFVMLGITAVFALVAAAYKTSFFGSLISTIIPFFAGFNWGRVSFFNRIVVNVLFALTLVTLLRSLQLTKLRSFVYVIACLQIFVVLTYQGFYSYSGINLNYSVNVQRDEMLTYREFFAEDFFSAIMDDLGYAGEGVAALGYHPSVLMYNGFSCVDGYMNSYPLARMLAFREVIAPQLERNPDHKAYFDGWGGRMYLFNDDISYEPTRTKADSPVELHINTEAFRRLGGVFILSRVEISNAEELELGFVNRYYSDKSVYEVFVYRTE